MKKKIKKRMRKHGFLERSKTPDGRSILRRRRAKGRKQVAVTREKSLFLYENRIKERGGSRDTQKGKKKGKRGNNGGIWKEKNREMYGGNFKKIHQKKCAEEHNKEVYKGEYKEE